MRRRLVRHCITRYTSHMDIKRLLILLLGSAIVAGVFLLAYSAMKWKPSGRNHSLAGSSEDVVIRPHKDLPANVVAINDAGILSAMFEREDSTTSDPLAKSINEKNPYLPQEALVIKPAPPPPPQSIKVKVPIRSTNPETQ